MGTQLKSSGFTLIEMMIAIMMTALLAAVVTPKFSRALVKGKEASTKGNLAVIRSAVGVYYADHEGQYPSSLSELTSGSKYLSNIPEAYLPAHGGSL